MTVSIYIDPAADSDSSSGDVSSNFSIPQSEDSDTNRSNPTGSVHTRFDSRVMSRRRRSSESLDSGRSPSRLDQRFRPGYELPSVQGPSRTRIPNTAREYPAYSESEASDDNYDEWASLPSPVEQRPRGFITTPPGHQYPKPPQQRQARPINFPRPSTVEDWDENSVKASPRISYQVDRDISRPSYSSSRASSPRGAVKSTISEDLSTEDRDQGAKLRFLQTRLQKQSFNLRPTQRP